MFRKYSRIVAMQENTTHRHVLVVQRLVTQTQTRKFVPLAGSSTSLMQVVRTACSKSANIKMQQV